LRGAIVSKNNINKVNTGSIFLNDAFGQLNAPVNKLGKYRNTGLFLHFAKEQSDATAGSGSMASKISNKCGSMRMRILVKFLHEKYTGT
jgi:hypothetical protein